MLRYIARALVGSVLGMALIAAGIVGIADHLMTGRYRGGAGSQDSDD